MAHIHFRAATQADLPILLDFEKGIVTAERPYDPTLKPGKIHYYDIGVMIDSSDTEVIVAVCDNEIIGSAYVKIKKASPYLKFTHYGYLGFMYVKPEYRGQGVNKGIVGELKAWARSKDLKELKLDVYSENQPALKAYEKAGFNSHLINMRMKI